MTPNVSNHVTDWIKHKFEGKLLFLWQSWAAKELHNALQWMHKQNWLLWSKTLIFSSYIVLFNFLWNCLFLLNLYIVTQPALYVSHISLERKNKFCVMLLHLLTTLKFWNKNLIQKFSWWQINVKGVRWHTISIFPLFLIERTSLHLLAYED